MFAYFYSHLLWTYISGSNQIKFPPSYTRGESWNWTQVLLLRERPLWPLDYGSTSYVTLSRVYICYRPVASILFKFGLHVPKIHKRQLIHYTTITCLMFTRTYMAVLWLILFLEGGRIWTLDLSVSMRPRDHDYEQKASFLKLRMSWFDPI